YGSLQYRFGGDIITTGPFNVTVRASGLPTYTTGDNIYMEMYADGGNTVFAFYKNGSFAGSYTYPGLITGNEFITMRGRGTFVSNKLAYVTERYAAQVEVGAVSQEVSDLATTVSQLNPNYPFHGSATFVNGNAVDVSWLKNAVIDIKLYGFAITDRISPFVIRKDYLAGHQYMFSMWRDDGDGSGVPEDRVKVLEWFENNYTPPPSGQVDVIEYNDGAGHGMKIYVDWDQVPSGQNTAINYNAGGLSQQALINFSTGAVPPPTQANRVVSWHDNDADAPVTGADQFAQFTVVP